VPCFYHTGACLHAWFGLAASAQPSLGCCTLTTFSRVRAKCVSCFYFSWVLWFELVHAAKKNSLVRTNKVRHPDGQYTSIHAYLCVYHAHVQVDAAQRDQAAHKGHTGTVRYMAPEVISQRTGNYTVSAQVCFVCMDMVRCVQ
jgi:hypothetical protein